MPNLGTLRLTITNSQNLLPGIEVQKQFDEEGGMIGSEPSSYWYVKDNKNQIHNTHCQISIVDGFFCLSDNSNKTFINGATFALGWGKLAKLNDGDTISIGSLMIRVSMQHENDDSDLDLGQVIIEEDDFDLDEALSFSAKEKEEEVNIEDPIAALNLHNPSDDPDSLLLSPEESKALTLEKDVANPAQGSGHQLVSQADTEREMSSAFAISSSQSNGSSHSASNIQINNYKDNLMDEQALDLLEEEMQSGFSNQPDSQSVDKGHLVTGPLLRGLGTQTTNQNDLAAMHHLSEEMGASLKSAIQGLLDLHQHVSASRYGVMNKNLQPIEDNPLRLGMSYEETVKMMFDGNPSPVHLSAPEAIDESLKLIKHHNEAVQNAISTALNQILQAFSPEVLMRRFNRYRRSSQVQTDTAESWAWDMYQNYYQELTSNRQNGFEKLFWEIFEQAYDKDLRQQQGS
ncbi:type VI secretion system-associated FHA domain protein TagH [Vibrio sp. S4M6]|uniref:type VI secretion system-associated FHA domain protein TagH n=1 Tax=Vibrio sinus TaxID=2946865 RepID=UPI00202A8B46|nr:type VI secretion system-associated FHA domain protein TagH [Vibrio sinus]MCL9781345.1 type VI secretion system-associated FHA domain protein TagH [Vibrio sinus]